MYKDKPLSRFMRVGETDGWGVLGGGADSREETTL